MMKKRREPSRTISSRHFVHTLKVRRQLTSALRPTLRRFRLVSSGLIPSLHHLVSFDRFHGTMNQSDSRPQLGLLLWFPLRQAPVATTRRTRSGLSGSVSPLPYMMRSSTPVERRRLAIATFSVLPSPVGTGSASTTINLSKLNSAPYTTPVYASDQALPQGPQDSVPICRLGSGWTGLPPASDIQLCLTHSLWLLELA